MSNPSLAVVLEETPHWLAVDKPAGLVVHDVPGEKHAGHTLVDWLRDHVPAINENFPGHDPRPGIVHRLDADTSGVILIAKDPATLKELQDQFRQRETEKIYQALVLGDPPEEGSLVGSIARTGSDTKHAVKRLTFSWEKGSPKPAETDYRVLRRLTDTTGHHYTLLELRPKTGRTHQLRVQLADASWPIIGDPMYATKASREASARLHLHRQFLHAVSLTFTNPVTDERVTVSSPLAADVQRVLDTLLSEHAHQ
ncbi:RluA family pseudouridine synthase [Candidatus Berkelbacteria bacterium]|nr:RluA family pseudouridine synthase [Candidatus Berkelbacteria bacterium]